VTTTNLKAILAATIAALLGAAVAFVSRPPETPMATTTPAIDVRNNKASAPIEAPHSPNVPWFPTHQRADGSWGDSATTGIVLLTFLGAGETQQSGSCRPIVKKGLDALRAGQDADGCLAEPTSPRRLRDHAIAGLALSEAYGMTSALALKPAAQHAVDFALKMRAPGGAWNFTSRRPEQIDVEATVWMAMLLKSARMSELDVDPVVLGEVASALDRISDPKTGRIIGAPNSPTMFSSDAATAAALVVRVLCGRLDTTDALTAKSADVLVAHPPTAASTDLPYVYFSGLAMIGLAGDRFRAWLPGLNAFVQQPQMQRRDGPDAGSWDPPEGQPESWRIWATAYHLLVGEFYYGRVGHASMRRSPAPLLGRDSPTR